MLDGNTPLHITASNGDTEAVTIILRHIKPPDVVNIQNTVHVGYLGLPYMVWAVATHSYPHHLWWDGNTPLHIATSRGDAKSVSYVISKLMVQLMLSIFKTV